MKIRITKRYFDFAEKGLSFYSLPECVYLNARDLNGLWWYRSITPYDSLGNYLGGL